MPDFSNLKAAFVNCSLKKARSESHTGRLISHAAAVMEHNDVDVDHIHALEHQIGELTVYPLLQCVPR